MRDFGALKKQKNNKTKSIINSATIFKKQMTRFSNDLLGQTNNNILAFVVQYKIVIFPCCCGGGSPTAYINFANFHKLFTGATRISHTTRLFVVVLFVRKRGNKTLFVIPIEIGFCLQLVFLAHFLINLFI